MKEQLQNNKVELEQTLPFDQEEHNRKLVDKFIRDKEKERLAINLAIEIRGIFGRNWFTLYEYYKYVEKQAKDNLFKPQTIQELDVKIEVLGLFGFVKRKKGKTLKYKIVMTVLEKAMRATAEIETAKNDLSE